MTQDGLLLSFHPILIHTHHVWTTIFAFEIKLIAFAWGDQQEKDLVSLIPSSAISSKCQRKTQPDQVQVTGSIEVGWVTQAWRAGRDLTSPGSNSSW